LRASAGRICLAMYLCEKGPGEARQNRLRKDLWFTYAVSDARRSSGAGPARVLFIGLVGVTDVPGQVVFRC
jgi:hypothetical protein